MKTNLKEKKAAKAAAKRQEDIKSYRLMIEFLLVIVALFLAITAGNNALYVLSKVMPLALTVTGVLFGLSALYFSVMRIKRVDETDKIVTSTGIFGNAAALFALCAAFYLYMSAQIVISALIALAVVYIVYNVEGSGFFGYSALVAAAYISLLLLAPSIFEQSYFAIGDIIINVAKAVAFAVPVLMIVIAVLIFTKKKGVTVLGVKFAKKRIATALIVSALIALAGVVCALVYPAGISIAVYVLLAVYFAVTVIGIFKMM